MTHTSTGIAYDRAGPVGETPVVLVHAGIADRRMWDPLWSSLTAERDTVRLDLRGFGDSTARPPESLSPASDVIDTLEHLNISRCHLVGVSFGAGVAAEVALTRPEVTASLLLVSPGGCLLTDETDQLRAFTAAEDSALEAGDLDAAVEANLSWWVDGPQRGADAVDSTLRSLVGRMQRRAFELTADWDDIDEIELDPPAAARLHEITAPTLVVVGALDMDSVMAAAHRTVECVAGARLVEWPDVAHLPPLEEPAAFTALLRNRLIELAA